MNTATFDFTLIEKTRDSLEETEKQLQKLHMESSTHDEVKRYSEERHLVSDAIRKIDSVLSYLNNRQK